MAVKRLALALAFVCLPQSASGAGALRLKGRVQLNAAPATVQRKSKGGATLRAAHANSSAAAPQLAVPVAHFAAGKASVVGNASQFPTFQQFYNAYSYGRGIWKWSNALDAYQRHFGAMAGQPLKLAEVGVQSGGSIQMWRSVLGPHCHVYGIDINPKTMQFQDPMATIIIGDQADANMWYSFFTHTVRSPIDILIDDGGHEAHQMLVTLQQTFDHLTPGGFVAIEDIHGEHYIDSFFVPAAGFFAAKASQGQLSSVHVYPYMLVAQRGGNDWRAPLHFTGSSTVVDSFASMWAAIPHHAGGFVTLENAGWGPFLTNQGLINFFKVFAGLHHSQWFDTPTGCEKTAAAVCAVTVRTGPMQASITGIHIYPTKLVVEVAGAPVTLQAVRRGTIWIDYA